MGELNDILVRAQASLGTLAGAPTALDGGITNRNFHVTLGNAEYVIRQPGKATDLLGIDREGERVATEAAARLGIAPPVALVLDDCLVTRFVACSALTPQAVADHVAELARALRRFHDSAVVLPTSFRVGALLDRYAALVAERGGRLPSDYSRAVSAAARIEAALPLHHACPCHNDLLSGNVIRAEDDGRLLIVDWEYAAMGDPRFDLGNMSINNAFDESSDDRLLSAYYTRAPVDAERAALKLMRVLSDARETGWAVVQGQISALDFDFEGYGSEHLERLLAAVEQPQFEQWLAAARRQAGVAGGQTA